MKPGSHLGVVPAARPCWGLTASPIHPDNVDPWNQFWRNHPWRLRLSALVVAPLAVGLLQWLAPGGGGGRARAGWCSGLAPGGIHRARASHGGGRHRRAQPARARPLALAARHAGAIDPGVSSGGRLGSGLRHFVLGQKDGDVELRQAWALAPMVAAQVFSIDPSVTPRSGAAAGGLAATGCPAFAPKSYGLYGTANELLLAKPAVGHVTPRIERDGVVRKLPALVCHEGHAYPSLALTAFWRAAQGDAAGGLPAPDWQWHWRRDEGGGSAMPVAWLTSASLPGLIVPLDAQGDLRVPYRLDRRAFASISAAEVLRAGSDLSLLKGTIVLVGATAFGIGDTVATPHAAVAGSGSASGAGGVAGPSAASTTSPCLAMAVGGGHRGPAGGAGRATEGRSAKRLPLAGLVLAMLCWAGASAALLQTDLWLPWASAAMFAVLA